MRDDGIGVHVIRHLQGKLPGGVELVEGSIYSVDLLTVLENRRKVVFIDGIDAGEPAGEIFRFSLADVPQRRTGVPLSLHDFGIYELVAAAKLLDQCPGTVILIAVQVGDVELGERLSDQLAESIPRICQLVLDEVIDSGKPCRT
ncbi:MAG: hydrogenase maturation protease [Actinobacteria bacterium]|nr:hydrogenase maturation protease [Actinomycetota bacterium]